MHKTAIIEFPDLTSSFYCSCGKRGRFRSGEKSLQNAILDSQAHLENEILDSWAREISKEANLSECPLCITAFYRTEDYPDYIECSNHSFKESKKSGQSILTLESSYADANQLAVDLSWDERCPVLNCPGILGSVELVDETDCSAGHSLKISYTFYPFMYCEVL